MSNSTKPSTDLTAPPIEPPSALGICNLALSKLGESPISAIDANGSPAARMCYLHYHPVRREVLMAHRWTFATRLVTLSASDELPTNSAAASAAAAASAGTASSAADPDAESAGSTAADPDAAFGPMALLPHSLPGDCLRVLEVNRKSWILRGRSIYCPGDRVRLLSIADHEDPALFDPPFIDALATKLAVRLCIPLTSSTTAREALTEEYRRLVLPQAEHLNAVQCFSNDSHPLYRLWKQSGSVSEW